MGKETATTPETPEITQTSGPSERENHEKYSADDRIVGQERDDLHHASALGADHRVNLVDLADHLGPALGGDGPDLLLDSPEWKRPGACLPYLRPIRG